MSTVTWAGLPLSAELLAAWQTETLDARKEEAARSKSPMPAGAACSRKRRNTRVPLEAERDTTTPAQLTEIVRSAPSLAERDQAAADEAEAEALVHRSKIQKVGLDDFGMLESADGMPAVDVLLGVFDKPVASIEERPDGKRVLNMGKMSAAARAEWARGARARARRMALVFAMFLVVCARRGVRKLRAAFAGVGKPYPFGVEGPAMPFWMWWSANRVAALEGGVTMGDREGRPEATDLDQMARGANDLGLKDFCMPCLEGRGGLDLSRIPCRFGCEGCKRTGIDLQSLAEVYEGAKEEYKAQHPLPEEEGEGDAAAAEAAAVSAGFGAVVFVIGLIEAGEQERAIRNRVTCANWRCMLAAGIIRTSERVKWLAGLQYAGRHTKNKRDGSKELFLRNLVVIHQMYIAGFLTRDQVATAVTDVEKSTFWVETRRREYAGVAVVLAKSAQDMGYPLTGRDTKETFVARMCDVPSHFVNTVLREHVLTAEKDLARRSSKKRGGRVKTWRKVLEDLLKQSYPDPLTTAHADLMYRTWVRYGRQCDDCGNPRHEIESEALLGGAKAALFKGAAGFHSVVAPHFKAAHQHKIKLLFRPAAEARDEGGDMHAAIAATSTKCLGLRTAGQKAQFERMVMMNPEKRERVCALIPSAGGASTMKCRYAPADNALRRAFNTLVWEKTVAALRCLGVGADPDDVSPEAFALAFLAPHTGERGVKGWTIRPAKEVFDARRGRSVAARQRKEVWNRNAAAGFKTTLGAARRVKDELFLGFEPVRSCMSGVGMRVYRPKVAQLSECAAKFREERLGQCTKQTLEALRRLCADILAIRVHVILYDEDGRAVPDVEVGLPTNESAVVGAGGVDWEVLEYRHTGDEGKEPIALWVLAEELSVTHDALNAFAKRWEGRLEQMTMARGEHAVLLAHCEAVLEARSLKGLPFVHPGIGLVLKYTADMVRNLAAVVSGIRNGARVAAGGALPETLAKDVVHTRSLAKRPGDRRRLHDRVDHAAALNVMENHQMLVDTHAVSKKSFPLDDYYCVDQHHFFEMAETHRSRWLRRWWEATQVSEAGVPGAWHCANPACVAAHRRWSFKLGDHTCKCANSKSFAAYLSKQRVNEGHLWPTLLVERDRFCRQYMINEQANVDRLLRIVKRTEDDTEDVLKITTAMDALEKKGVRVVSEEEKKRNPKVKVTAAQKRLAALQAKLVKFKGRCAVLLERRARVKLHHVTKRAISRFARGVVDEETVPLIAQFNREVERVVGGIAKRHCAQRLHLARKDDSIYGGANHNEAAINAEAAGLLGVELATAPASFAEADALVASDGEDSSDDEEGDERAAAANRAVKRDLRAGARKQAAVKQRLAEVAVEDELEPEEEEEVAALEEEAQAPQGSRRLRDLRAGVRKDAAAKRRLVAAAAKEAAEEAQVPQSVAQAVKRSRHVMEDDRMLSKAAFKAILDDAPLAQLKQPEEEKPAKAKAKAAGVAKRRPRISRRVKAQLKRGLGQRAAEQEEEPAAQEEAEEEEAEEVEEEAAQEEAEEEEEEEEKEGEEEEEAEEAKF